MGYVLAVDGGQSTTLSVIANTDGTILGTGLGGPANHLHQKGAKERCKRSLFDSLSGAVFDAGLDSVIFDCALLGMTGGASGWRLMMDLAWEVLQGWVDRENLNVEHDSVTAWAGATAGKPGVVVIAGTGSVALAVDDKDNRSRVGGWGYYMGDEGSAYQIALQGLSAASKGFDGRGPKTVLIQSLVNHFGADDLWGVRAKIYSDEMDRAGVAGLSKLVGDGANQGDPVCLAIMEKAACELAVQVKVAAKGVDFSNIQPIVSVAGGVWKAGDPIWIPFRNKVVDFVPNARVVAPVYPPSLGALVLALSNAGVVLSQDIFKNIDKTKHKVLKKERV